MRNEDLRERLEREVYDANVAVGDAEAHAARAEKEAAVWYGRLIERTKLLEGMKQWLAEVEKETP